MDRDSFHKTLIRRAYGLFLAGNTYNCPFCHHTFRKFLPGGSRSPKLKELKAVGIGRRQNARCPHCGSNDRARLLALYLATTDCVSGRPLRVLDIAPDRHVARFLKAQSKLAYSCGSLHPEDFSDLDALEIDVTAIPFPDDSFDVLLCNHVLQEVPDDRKAMQEIRRVLRPTGWGIVQVPIALGLSSTEEDTSALAPQERRLRFGSTRHVRLYGQDTVTRFREEGLLANLSHPLEDNWCLDAQRFAVIPDERVCVVRKISAQIER